MILLLDNYDSFTYNLEDYLIQAGVHPTVMRNDEGSVEEFKKLPLNALVISPGPERPNQAGWLMPILAHFIERIPVLGICLGHQAIGLHYGGQLVRAPQAVHGKTSTIHYQPHFIFEGLDPKIDVMRYHSLIIEETPEILHVIAETNDSINMAMQHQTLPVTSLQFHPESIGTSDGLQIIKNWVQHHNL